MIRQEIRLGLQNLLADTRQRAFYEIYPDLTLQGEDAPSMWFEIALHIEADEPWPPDHPKSREASTVLTGLGQMLIQRATPPASCGLERLAPYYTLHPAEHRGRPRMAFTLSLVFLDVGPYTRLEEPGLLTQLKADLALLGIPRSEILKPESRVAPVQVSRNSDEPNDVVGLR